MSQIDRVTDGSELFTGFAARVAQRGDAGMNAATVVLRAYRLTRVAIQINELFRHTKRRLNSVPCMVLGGVKLSIEQPPDFIPHALVNDPVLFGHFIRAASKAAFFH